MERTAYGRTNASLTRLRGSAQRPAEGKGLDRGFSLRQNLTPNRTARLVISGGSIVTPGATSIMVNPKRKKAYATPGRITVVFLRHSFSLEAMRCLAVFSFAIPFCVAALIVRPMTLEMPRVEKRVDLRS